MDLSSLLCLPNGNLRRGFLKDHLFAIQQGIWMLWREKWLRATLNLTSAKQRHGQAVLGGGVVDWAADICTARKF